MEFITYSVIFSQKSKRTLDIVCTKVQGKRIRIILQEAMFGPVFKNIFSSFLFDLSGKLHFNKRQTVSLDKLVRRALDQGLFSRFKDSMNHNLSKKKVVLKMRPVLRPYFEKVPWLI